MPGAAILNPIQTYFDLDGSPLQNGQIFFGAPGGNPETSPQAVYWDAALTIPAAQPIRTINGFPARNGRPAILYSGSDFSQTVKNQRGTLVFYLSSSAISGSVPSLPNGTAGAPALAFQASPTTGLFSPGANQGALSANGVERLRWTPLGVGIGGGNPAETLDVFGTSRLRGTLTVTLGGVVVQAGGVTVATGGVTITAGGLTISAGGFTVTGNSSVAGNFSVTGGVFASRGFTDNATVQSWNLDTAGRLRNNAKTQISFCARRTGSNQTTAGNVIFNDIAFTGGHNFGGCYDPATGVFTVPAGQAGQYLFCANVPIDNTSGADVYPGIGIRISGSDVIKPVFATKTGVGTPFNFFVILDLAAGDTVSVRYDAAVASAVLVGSTFSGRQLG